MSAERCRGQRTRVSGNHVALVTRELGALIRQERRRQQMGQEELAAEARVSQPALSYLERGLCYPKVETLERIAVALGWRFEDFVGEARRRAELRLAEI